MKPSRKGVDGSTESNTRAREERGRKGENTLEIRGDALLDWEESDLKYMSYTYEL
jgi:hypothetical protein